MIALAEYKKIFARPGRPTDGFEEGLDLTAEDETILDRAWAEVAAEDDVKQLADQMTPVEIRDWKS